MNRNLAVLSLVLAALAHAAFVQTTATQAAPAQTTTQEAEATDLLERAREAHGGEVLAALESLREVATLTYYGPGGEAVSELRAESLVDFVNERFRLEFFEGGTLVLVQQLNEEGGVTWTQQTGELALPAAQEAELRESFLRAYYGLRVAADARDEAVLEGEAAFIDLSGQALRVTTEGVSTLYLVGEDGRLLGERYPTLQLGEVTALYEDYREVDGVFLPHASRLYAGEMLFASTETESFEVDPPLSDEDFALP